MGGETLGKKMKEQMEEIEDVGRRWLIGPIFYLHSGEHINCIEEEFFFFWFGGFGVFIWIF